MNYINRNQLHNMTMEIINERKLNAETKSDAINNLVWENEEYKKLQSELNAVLRQIGYQKFKKGDISELMSQKGVILAELEKFLTEKGLKIVSPEYTCKLCNDTGIKDGKRCKCYHTIYNKILMLQCGVSLDDIPYIEDIDTSVYESKNIEKVLNFLKTLLEKFDETKYMKFILTGDTGVGKTYLSKAFMKSVLRQGKSALFMSAFNINDIFKAYYLAGEKEKENIISPLLDCDLLVIDDIGVEKVYKNITAECYYILIEERENSGKKTFITTNCIKTELEEKYGVRMTSRLYNKRTTIESVLLGKDLRTTK